MTNESNHQLLINVIQSALAENRENGDRPRFGAGPNQTSFVESMLQYLCSYLDSEDDWKTGSAQPNIMTIFWIEENEGLFDFLISWGKYGFSPEREWEVICDSYQQDNPIPDSFVCKYGMKRP